MLTESIDSVKWRVLRTSSTLGEASVQSKGWWTASSSNSQEVYCTYQVVPSVI